AGLRLPSTRALAAELGASRTTVPAAFEQLLAEGFIETKQGRQARVSATFVPAPHSRARNTHRTRAARLSGYGREVMEFRAPPVPPGRLLVDFRNGDVATSDFPLLAWRRAL